MKKLSFALDSLLPLLAVTAFCLLYKEHLELLNIGMLYMLPILFTAVRHSNLTTLGVSLVAALLFDVLYVPPVFHITVHDARYLLSFAIMVAVGQLVSYLSQRAAKIKELEAAERIYAAILDSVSHELRTPLTAVIGASSALTDNELSLSQENRVELCETVHEGAKCMEAIVENLLASARFESGTIKLNKSECRADELVSTALQKCEKIYMRNARLSLNENLPSIFVDAGLIELALYNVFNNAFKYGQEVNINVIKTPLGVKITIKNDIDAADTIQTDGLGEKFSRLANSSGKSGMGLGLFLCKKIIAEHGGNIDIYTSNGLFCVEILLRGDE